MRATLLPLAWLAAVALGGAAVAQEDSERADRSAASQPPATPDIVVRGRRVEELRLEIEIAQEAIFQRFNDINSDDRFDIHCYTEVRYHSHIKERVCLSNSWREQNANAAEAALRRVRGESTPPPEAFQAEQLAVEHRLGQEMRRLANDDPQLRQAVIDLAKAQFALAEHLGNPLPWSVAQQVQAGTQSMPYGAQRMFEVRIGKEPWQHTLTERTFTMAQVYGDIRKLELECNGEKKRVAYEPGLEWTVPAGMSDCVLSVHAKPDTTFALYEFE